MFGIPFWFGAMVSFLLGTIMGSFLDVCASRFHTGRSINGRSHCTSCGHTLAWYELFPLLSYVFLRGRCRVCHARIPARLFWMEVITGVAFILAWTAAGTVGELAIGFAFAMLAIIITSYDVRHLVIPNFFVALTAVLAIVQLFIRAGVPTFATLLDHVFAALAASAFYATLWYVSRGRWIGFGDVKLALPLGFMLTLPQVFSFVVLSFWVGAAISVTLLLLQWLVRRGQTYLRSFDIALTMKSEVPFAPFLLIAFALVYFFGADVLTFFI